MTDFEIMQAFLVQIKSEEVKLTVLDHGQHCIRDWRNGFHEVVLKFRKGVAMLPDAWPYRFYYNPDGSLSFYEQYCLSHRSWARDAWDKRQEAGALEG